MAPYFALTFYGESRVIVNSDASPDAVGALLAVVRKILGPFDPNVRPMRASHGCNAIVLEHQR